MPSRDFFGLTFDPTKFYRWPSRSTETGKYVVVQTEYLFELRIAVSCVPGLPKRPLERHNPRNAEDLITIRTYLGLLPWT